MKTIKFILGKIVIVEVMLIILYFATFTFNVHISLIDDIISLGLKYLTPVAVLAIIPYIILSLLDNRFVETVVAVVIGILIAYYLLGKLGLI